MFEKIFTWFEEASGKVIALVGVTAASFICMLIPFFPDGFRKFCMVILFASVVTWMVRAVVKSRE